VLAGVGGREFVDLPWWVMVSWANRSRPGLVSSVRRRKVPAGPVQVPRWMRSSSRRLAGQVCPVLVSAMRVSSSASSPNMRSAHLAVASLSGLSPKSLTGVGGAASDAGRRITVAAATAGIYCVGCHDICPRSPRGRPVDADFIALYDQTADVAIKRGIPTTSADLRPLRLSLAAVGGFQPSYENRRVHLHTWLHSARPESIRWLEAAQRGHEPVRGEW
jgi:hypothetical protein